MTTVEISGVGPQWVDTAAEGQTVTFSVPDGCRLLRKDDQGFVLEARQSPFVHSGPSASYRIDCVEYSPGLVAVLEISS